MHVVPIHHHNEVHFHEPDPRRDPNKLCNTPFEPQTYPNMFDPIGVQMNKTSLMDFQ